MALTISLQFPTGRYVAGRWDDREELEWPPHPARLCLGLIDALHRGGNLPPERAALEWLCAQGAPHLAIPAEAEISRQKLDGFFVPQNPSDLGNGLQHPRKARAFPLVALDPDQPTVWFHWPAAEAAEEIRDALGSLLERLPRFGHSSSFCLARIADSAPPDSDWQCLEPISPDSTLPPEHQLRVPYAGLLAAAEAAFDAADREAEMRKLITAAAKSAKPDKPLKPAASPRGRHDPPRRWQNYALAGREPAALTPWDSRLLILRQTSGTRLGIVSTWQVTERLHKAILSNWDDAGYGPIPAWLSGHETRPAPGQSGAPLRTRSHLAIVPLPYVGATHADGHLLGLALALPRPESAGVTPADLRRQWQQAMAALFGSKETLKLHAHDGSWEIHLQPEAAFSNQPSRQALDPGRWTRPALVWQTVTPILLDRHPKPDFRKNPEAWKESCRKIIRQSCANLRLPEPVRIDPAMIPPLPGVPYAGKFPAPGQRPGMPVRVRVHATIEFPQAIQGPLLLGAGRHRGYGLMLPVSGKPNPSSIS